MVGKKYYSNQQQKTKEHEMEQVFSMIASERHSKERDTVKKEQEEIKRNSIISPSI